MEIDNILALIFRLGVMVLVYFLLFLKFYRGYKKSKESGFKNTYFLGFSVLFFILFVFHILYGAYELYINTYTDYYELKGQFAWYVQSDDFVGDIVNNQMRPAFLIFYFLMNCVLAAQIYPLEKASNWHKNPIMKLILICGSSVWLLFIPIIGNSSFALIPVLLAFVGIAIGFMFNIFMLSKLYKAATGDVKQKALYGVLAFLFLAIGLVLAMEVGWAVAISPALTYRWEVVIGSIIQIIGAVFYYKGFTQES